MNVKQYIKRVMEENNKELLKYFRNYVTNSLTQYTTDLQNYIAQQIAAMPETYTKQETIEVINNAIEEYDIEVNANFRSADHKVIVGSDNKLFIAK